jgi:hypothetical protein
VRGKGFFDYQGKPIEVNAEMPESKGPFGNFLHAIRTGNPDDNFAPPEVAHAGCAHIHLGNIAYRLGRSLEFNPIIGEFKNDAEANAMLKRDYRDPFVVPEIA